MKRSNNRILSTHVGSLARPRSLLQTMKEKESGRQYDQKLFELQIREAVSEVVRKQADIGIDIVGDGEMSKVGFLNYVKDRLKGFDESDSKPLVPASWKAEIDAFPEYYEDYFKKYSNVVTPLRSLVCTGPVSYSGHADLMRDLGNLTNALKDLKVEEAFATATSPSGFGRNAYYATEEQYLYAVADALREEYTAIIKAGFVLQIDDPWLIEIVSDPTYDEKERQRAGVAHVEMLNYALRDLPEDRLRLHICYGLNHGPRTHDLPMAAVVNLMLAVNVCAYSFEAANPRHYHEWRLWESVKLPDRKILIPGVVGHATNYVEHPEMIAELLGNYANLVGRENVIAAPDCGFSSRASFAPEVHPTVAWAKLEALCQGAALASKRLWPTKALESAV